MKLIYSTIIFSVVTVLSMSSCTKNRCACTDGYIIDVKNASALVAKNACEGIQKDRKIISQKTTCKLQ